jgi:ABC-type uncharacterized transport system permease subunit
VNATGIAKAFYNETQLAGRLVRASIKEKLVYRFDLLVGFLRTFILIYVFRYLWLSLYGGRASVDGVSIQQAITYATMSMVIMPLFPSTLVLDVGARMRTGNILFDIMRPLYFGNLLLYQMTGQMIATLATSAAPMFLLSLVFSEIVLSASWLVWLSFGVSLFLGFLIHFLIDFITSMSGFWLTETWGIHYAKWSVVDALSGKYLPLWIFPPLLKSIVSVLPFRGILYSPLAIFVGQIPPERILPELAFQVVWIIALALIGRWAYAVSVRKLAVQGG